MVIAALITSPHSNFEVLRSLPRRRQVSQAMTIIRLRCILVTALVSGRLIRPPLEALDKLFAQGAPQ